MTRDWTATLRLALARCGHGREGRAVVAEAERVARKAALGPLEGPRSDEEGEVDPECHRCHSRPQRAKNEGEA